MKGRWGGKFGSRKHLRRKGDHNAWVIVQCSHWPLPSKYLPDHVSLLGLFENRNQKMTTMSTVLKQCPKHDPQDLENGGPSRHAQRRGHRVTTLPLP